VKKQKATATFFFLAVAFLVSFTGNAFAALSLDWQYLQNRAYEGGESKNIIIFAMRDENNLYVLEDVVSKIELFGAGETPVALSNMAFVGPYKIMESSGPGPAMGNSYVVESAMWEYWGLFNEKAYYMAEFQKPIENETYHLVINDRSGNTYEGYKLGRKESALDKLPLITSETLCSYKNENGDLFWRWPVQFDTFPFEPIRTTTWMGVYDGESLLKEIPVKVPLHMGWNSIHHSLLQNVGMLEGVDGQNTVLKIGIKITTEDGNLSTHSNAIEFDKAGTCGCDINFDDKTGLPEAIHALRVVGGVE
jgi:hypothetical protein